MSTVFPLEISITEFAGITRFFASGKFNEDGVFDSVITDGNNVLSRLSRHGFEFEDDDSAGVEDITLSPRIRDWLTGTMYRCVELRLDGSVFLHKDWAWGIDQPSFSQTFKDYINILAHRHDNWFYACNLSGRGHQQSSFY